MDNQSFGIILMLDQSPVEVFNAINNVRGWWSAEVEGGTEKLNDEFNYHYQDVHRCTMKIIESVPGKRVVWLCLDNYFSFTTDKTEWINTKVIFDITEKDGKTQLHFTHEGLVPQYECYSACVNGWTQYIQNSLPALIATGTGMPNAKETAYTIHEVAARFSQLAKEEKWFQIQEELFAEDVSSTEPAHVNHLPNVKGKAAVRKKGEDWVSRVESRNASSTSEPVIGGSYFAVGRQTDITVKDIGRIDVKEIMLYEVKDGKIISEQFFY